MPEAEKPIDRDIPQHGCCKLGTNGAFKVNLAMATAGASSETICDLVFMSSQ